MKEVAIIITFILFEIYQCKKHKKEIDELNNEIMMFGWFLHRAYTAIPNTKANQCLRKEIEELNILIVETKE